MQKSVAFVFCCAGVAVYALNRGGAAEGGEVVVSVEVGCEGIEEDKEDTFPLDRMDVVD